MSHIIADLQLHSKYSRAVSLKMDLFEIARWASKKGIRLVATGDWTHPLWLREIKTHLKEVSPGIFTFFQRPAGQKTDVFFLLSTEISSIYTQNGKMRRVHNLIFSPSILCCEKIIAALFKRGCNLMSDGRPIVGLSSKELLEIVLGIDQEVLFIPAHCWTPWFSLFGSKSGFDSIEECFGNLSKYIYAVETGLSSDPLMNWQIKELETRSIVSFSDAHSGPKLGREATVFIPTEKDMRQNTDLTFTYGDIVKAIRQDPKGRLNVGYTIEFFPEEGKYHWSGHRACSIRYNPQEVQKKGIICPVCHQSLTIGVENRVIELSDKIMTEDDLLFIKNSAGLTFVYDKEKKRRPFVSLVPLLEILAEIYNGSLTKALREYERLVTTFASEFDILLKKNYQDIQKYEGEKLAQGIRLVRERKVFIDPGYDSVFGKVQVFNNHHQVTDAFEKNEAEQQSLF